mgnify:CR=1 FL=1
MAGRHWILPVGRDFLQKTVLTAQRTDSVWHGISGTCEHGHASHHALNSGKHGPRSSSHQWCMIAQGSSLPLDVKMQATTQMRTKTLSCRSQGSRWPRIKAHYITHSMNVPWLSHLVWHSKPSNAMQVILTWLKMQHGTNYTRHTKCHATNMARM